MSRDPAENVERTLVASMSVRTPRLAQSRQGTPRPEGATVETLHTRDNLTPDEAREMADLLVEAADEADELDRQLLPHLEAFCAALDALEEAREGAH
jgi:hypothetical protein